MQLSCLRYKALPPTSHDEKVHIAGHPASMVWEEDFWILSLSLCLSLRGKELDKEKEKAVKSGGTVCTRASSCGPSSVRFGPTAFLWFFFLLCYFLVLPLPLPLASCCESFFRRLEEEEEEEEEEKETTVFDEYNTVSCRQITMRLSSCFLPCEKGVVPVYHARNTFLVAFVSQQTSNFA